MAKGYLYDNGDELITREDVNEVPDSSTAHAGDVLELDSNKKPKWTTPASGLPDATSASAGDVLSLDEDKEPVWSTPSGGGAITYIPVTFVESEPDPDTGETYYKFTTTQSYNSIKTMIMNGGILAFIGLLTRTLLGGETQISLNVLYVSTVEEDTVYYSVACDGVIGLFSSAREDTDISDPDDPIVFACNVK